MMKEVALETLPNVNIRDPSHDKNHLIMSVTGSISQNVFKKIFIFCQSNIIFLAQIPLKIWMTQKNNNSICLLYTSDAADE